MGVRLPSAVTNFKQKQSELGKIAANVYTQMGSTQGLINFPTPAVPLTELVAALNTYTVSLASAGKNFAKTQTAAKNAAKKALINLLRTQALYVTQVAQLVFYGTGTVNPSIISNIQNYILTSGFALNNAPGPVANQAGSGLPIVKKAISKSAGTFHLLLRNYTKQKKGVKIYQVNMRTSAHDTTPAGNIFSTPETTGNITIGGLTSGVTYDWQVGAIIGKTALGNQPPTNFTAWQQIVIQ